MNRSKSKINLDCTSFYFIKLFLKSLLNLTPLISSSIAMWNFQVIDQTSLVTDPHWHWNSKEIKH